MKHKIYLFALAALGDGLSGGDRIFIELSRRWSLRYPLTIYVWEEGLAMCKRQKLSGKFLTFHLVRVSKIVKFSFLITYIYRVLAGIYLGLTIKPEKNAILFSASEFWMDSLPAFLLKFRFKNSVKWVQAWYQTAPNPVKGFSEGKRRRRYRLGAFLYWLVQLSVKPLIERYADIVIVNNESERDRFPNKRTIVLIGAVDLNKISLYKQKVKSKKTSFEAVFQGRFHPQKGVLELIDIWKMIIKKQPKAKLALIGDGPLMSQVKDKIKKENLSHNIQLFGYLYDGADKYKIFSESKIVVHPAFYDSGGMASAEAMAFGIPCVGFNLKSYESYYPKGMVKVPVGDLTGFANAILVLLKNEHKRRKIGMEGKAMIEKSWSWDFRAKQIFLQIIEK